MAKKLEMTDGLYQALITATTIGYGDKAFEKRWGKFLSPLFLPTLTQAFSRWNDAAGPDYIEKNAEILKSKSFADAEVCQCLGKNFCKAEVTMPDAKK